MFLYKKYLESRGCKETLPIPQKEGIIIFQHEELGFKKVEAVVFSWSTIKSHPYCYVFSYHGEEDRGKFAYNNNEGKSVDWNNFFQEIYKLKTRIKELHDVYLPKTKDEALCLAWRHFVFINDYTFAKKMTDFPSIFYDTINEEIPIEARKTYIFSFLDYLQENDLFVHSGWFNYFNYYIDNVFCDWFFNYFYEES